MCGRIDFFEEKYAIGEFGAFSTKKLHDLLGFDHAFLCLIERCEDAEKTEALVLSHVEIVKDVFDGGVEVVLVVL